MLKPIIAALLLTNSFPAFAVPEEAGTETAVVTPVDTSGKKEMDDMMSIFTKMFDTSDLPEPEPARLKLAEITASKLLPDGTYSRILDHMIGGIVTSIFNAAPGLTDSRILTATGVSEEVVAALTEEQKTAVTQIIDPDNKERAQQIADVLKPIISDAMAVMEPAMRKGLSRAYARKFSASQLTTINGFFATPVGSAFARESLALQADPEVVQATLKAFPAIFTNLMADEAKYRAKFEALPKPRGLKDLSEAETRQLATALGVDFKTLDDLRALAGAIDPYADETGTEPWYGEDAWSAAERKKIKAREAEYNAATIRYDLASEQSSAAFAAYREAFDAAVGAARNRLLADGWTPSDESSDATGDRADVRPVGE